MSSKLSGTAPGLFAVAMLCVTVVSGAETGPTPVQAAGAGDARAEYATKGDLGFQWSGDVRVRNEFMTTSTPGGGPPATVHDNWMYRLRTRLRIGAKGKLGEQASYGFRLETAANNATSGNATLGGGSLRGNGGNFGVGLAYLGFQVHPKVSLTAGKMSNPFWNGELLWDSDLQPEGVQVGWDIYDGHEGDIFRDLHSETAIYYLGQKTTSVSGLPVAIAEQLTGKVGPTKLGLGLVYYAENLSGNAPASNFTKDGDALIHGKAEYGFNAFGVPLKVGGEAVYNTSETFGEFGWELRLDAPKAGPGKAHILLRDVGQMASYAPWSDSDLGGAPGLHSGLEAAYEMAIAKPVTFEVAFYHWDTRSSTVAPGTVNLLQLDLKSKF